MASHQILQQIHHQREIKNWNMGEMGRRRGIGVEQEKCAIIFPHFIRRRRMKFLSKKNSKWQQKPHKKQQKLGLFSWLVSFNALICIYVSVDLFQVYTVYCHKKLNMLFIILKINANVLNYQAYLVILVDLVCQWIHWMYNTPKAVVKLRSVWSIMTILTKCRKYACNPLISPIDSLIFVWFILNIICH